MQARARRSGGFGIAVRWLLVAAPALVAAPLFAPPLLAAPYKEQVGAHVVRSVEPITPAIRAAVREADRRVSESPSGHFRAPDQAIFLTGGGWRWLWLAGTARGGFGLTRAVNDTIVLNHVDHAAARVYNGAPVGGQRLLAGVIAHEMTHGALRAHFGFTVDLAYPAELREGYCDYVAQEGSLSDADAEALRRREVSHPALIYWSGRKRIAAEMARPGMTVDRLFADWSAGAS